MLKQITRLFPLCLLGACATALPAVDRDRTITLNWNLEPTQSSVKEFNASQGEVLLTWRAAAVETHTLSDGTALINANTRYGVMYCSFEATTHCYEDRDGDNRLDHQWTLAERTRSQLSPFIAKSPQPLETKLDFEAVDSAEAVPVLDRTAALIYDGPREGALADDGVTFKTMIGQMVFGWLDESAPRSPGAETWRQLQIIPVAILTVDPIRTKVIELNLVYEVDQATIDGVISVSLEAGSVEGYGARQKLTFEVVPTQQTKETESTTAEWTTSPAAG